MQFPLNMCFTCMISVMGVQNRIGLENHKPNRTKLKAVIKLHLVWMCLGHLLTKLCGLVWFVVCILQTEPNWIKPHYFIIQTSLNSHPTQTQTHYALVLRLWTIFSSSHLEFYFQPSQISPRSITPSSLGTSHLFFINLYSIIFFLFHPFIFMLLFSLTISFLSHIFFSNLSSLSFFLFHIH